MLSNKQHDRNYYIDKIKAIQDELKKVMNIFYHAKNPDSNNEISTSSKIFKSSSAPPSAIVLSSLYFKSSALVISFISSANASICDPM